MDLTTVDDGEDESVDHEAEADKVFEKWIKFKPKYNDFLYEGVEKIKNMNSCTITELIDKFDTAKYFQVSWSLIFVLLSIHTDNPPVIPSTHLQNHGTENYMTISVLSRIHLSQFETGAEQERVFSSAKHAMGDDQAKMNFEMLQMRTLLSHNKQLIRRGIISICD